MSVENEVDPVDEQWPPNGLRLGEYPDVAVRTVHSTSVRNLHVHLALVAGTMVVLQAVADPGFVDGGPTNCLRKLYQQHSIVN